MENTDLMILDVIYKHWEKGDYLMDCSVLFENLEKLCFGQMDFVDQRVEFLWENGYIDSSNGQYFLTDKSLQVVRNIKQGRLH